MQIRLAIQAGVAVITLDRESKRNAQSRRMAAELLDALQRVEDSEARAVVVSGGPRVFSAGADLAELLLPRGDEPEPFDVYQALAHCPLPTIAAIEGYCLAGGLLLALCCDLRIAGRGARLGYPEVRRGFPPGAGGTVRLLRLLGGARVMELLYFGDNLDAATAHAWGLLNRVVDDGAATAEATAWAVRLAEAPPLAARTIKRIALETADADLGVAIAHERGLGRGSAGIRPDPRPGVGLPRACARPVAPVLARERSNWGATRRPVLNGLHHTYERAA